MGEKEFEKYLERTEQVILRHNIREADSKAAFLSGWVGASEGTVFTASQVKRLFELAYQE